MRFPFRIISARRLEQVEAVEKLNDLHFIRDAVEAAVQHLTEEIAGLRNKVSRFDGSVRDPLAMAAIEKRQTLRVNLLTVLFRVGR
jgi:Asp-tRNA(Asn)/Glu-tRNA(Gln) amidotransferase C subunit